MYREKGLWKYYIIIFLTVLFLLGYAAFYIWTLIEYGGKPASEIPGWVWWFWLGGEK